MAARAPLTLCVGRNTFGFVLRDDVRRKEEGVRSSSRRRQTAGGTQTDKGCVRCVNENGDGRAMPAADEACADNGDRRGTGEREGRIAERNAAMHSRLSATDGRDDDVLVGRVNVDVVVHAHDSGSDANRDDEADRFCPPPLSWYAAATGLSTADGALPSSDDRIGTQVDAARQRASDCVPLAQDRTGTVPDDACVRASARCPQSTADRIAAATTAAATGRSVDTVDQSGDITDPDSVRPQQNTLHAAAAAAASDVAPSQPIASLAGPESASATERSASVSPSVLPPTANAVATRTLPAPTFSSLTIPATGTLPQPLQLQNPTSAAQRSMTVVVGSTLPSPGWKEISRIYLPLAARELLSSSIRRICYTARVSYAKGHWYRKYSDMGNNMGGILKSDVATDNTSALRSHDDDSDTPDSVIAKRLQDLPPVSSLPWIDRQLVKEWRTYMPDEPTAVQPNPVARSGTDSSAGQDEDFDFDQARSLVPVPIQRPKWQKAEHCFACHKSFGPTRLRHHCRLCGNSFCQSDSSMSHSLPHLGYEPGVKERVCDSCKRLLEEQNLAERVAWRLARCRDFNAKQLTPYFELGIDSYEQVAIRVTKAAIAMAKSIPLGAQATVAVETVDVLRKYGLNGIYGLMLRQEFLAAADLLRKALGINKTSWPLSVHELSAAIFYALAQHRAIRGLNPEREHIIHAFRPQDEAGSQRPMHVNIKSSGLDESIEKSALSFHNDMSHIDSFPAEENAPDIVQTCYSATEPRNNDKNNSRIDTSNSANDKTGQPRGVKATPRFQPVCDPVPDPTIASLLIYAPIALSFIYATREVDMQLLAAQQGWVLLYAHLQQDTGTEGKLNDRPASAVFVHRTRRVACLAVRGTATISDVITDIRQIPVPFPENENEDEEYHQEAEDWTSISSAQGIALCGMASAATNLYREHIDALVALARQGYRIRLTGHSLGGGVAAMVAVLILRHFRREAGDLFETFSMPTASGTVDTTNEVPTLLRVYAYGTPSCMDAKLAEFVSPYVTTVVLHDDVFPRLTPTNCRRLLKHLLHIRETWVKRHMATDLKAIGERAKTAWAPRFRHSFTLAPARSIKRYYRKHFRSHSCTGKQGSGDNDDDHRRLQQHCTESCDGTLDDKSQTADHLLDFLGGANGDSDGIVVDGEEFFDTEEDNLIEASDDDDEDDDRNSNDGVIHGETFLEPMGDNNVLGDSWNTTGQSDGEQKRPADVSISASASTTSEARDCDGDEQDTPNAVVLEETPLPRMFVPGKVIHVYSHRGVYKAAYVPRTFRELRRISLAGNMLSDHTAKAYYEGLVEVQNARVAFERPPRWTAFDEDDTCSCCASRFTWASTSSSAAQEARDKHNCRSCGGLVCEPCSKNRVPIPSIGITAQVRVCDRCYHDINGTNSSRASAQSFLEVNEDDGASCEYLTSPDQSFSDEQGVNSRSSSPRPERQREKRSFVVDELASRIRSSALTSC